MGIIHLEEAKELRKEGVRLGRAGMSQRVNALVIEFIKDPSYKSAMHLAGSLKAIAIAAKCDMYWDEQVKKGYRKELYEIKDFNAIAKEEDKSLEVLKKTGEKII